MDSATVEAIVQQRIATLDYIKKAASGHVHWMNVMKLSPRVIHTSLEQKHIQKRYARGHGPQF
jgi:hypothetical protein